jgi:hypothetical protein
MEAMFPKTLVEFQHTARCYTPEDSTFHNLCCENLKSYNTHLILDQYKVPDENSENVKKITD